MWASVIPSDSFWRYQYFIVYHLLHGLDHFCPPPNPIKFCSLSSSFREWGGRGWLGSSETGGQEQASKPTLRWTFWILRPTKESFQSWSWNIGDWAFYVFWKESSLIHVELQCCWHKTATLRKSNCTQIHLGIYKHVLGTDSKNNKWV